MMRDLYDPVWREPTIQGFEEYHHHNQQQQQYRQQHLQQQQQSHRRQATLLKPSSSPSSKSSSSTSVLGRFLKLGKSKSDVTSGGLGYSVSTSGGGLSSSQSVFGVGTSGSRSKNSTSDDLDEFRLSPSVIARGPVEKMVHKANSRKDVSRSHSWIYGSVKLPGDLPFGYGDQFSFHENGGNGGGGESDEQVPRSSGHYLTTHSLHTMQIPRCQLDYYCTCDCGGEEMMLSPSGRPYVGAGGSVRAGGLSKRGKPPCQGCAREMAMKYALPAGKRKSGANGSSSGGGDSESFVSSVRKLTWKSLKQVVKKRPSLDTLKKMPPQQLQQIPPNMHQLPPEYLSAPIVPMPYLSPSAVAAASATSVDMLPSPTSPSISSQNHNPMANLVPNHYSSSQVSRVSHHPNSPPPQSPPIHDSEDPANYFFPEKKSFYASCNDIYGDDPMPNHHVTASVRVRPKRSRQTWQFPSSEFGPVPNYEEDAKSREQLYHSEWDLRNVMSYDVWMNATSNVKPRTAAPGPSSSGSNSSGSNSKSYAKSHVSTDSNSRHYHSQSSGNLHVPPPDYIPSKDTSTFRPTASNKIKHCSSSPNLDKISCNGSVKKSSSSSPRTSILSPSLNSPSSTSISSSMKSSSKSQNKINDKNSDTLSISSFQNTPSSSTKKPTANAGIVKRSSILAADVTAYQLLKAQTKKSSANSVQSSSSSSQGKASSSRPSRQAPQPSAESDLEDVFSESSDDLSDNAITGPNTHPESKAEQKSKTPPNTASSSGGGVRIAGQGIRMLPNSSGASVQKGSVIAPSLSSPSSSSISSSRGQSAIVTTTSSSRSQRPAEPSPRRDRDSSAKSSSSSIISTTLATPTSKVFVSGKEDDVDVWSDCHADSSPQHTMRQSMNTNKTVGLSGVDQHHQYAKNLPHNAPVSSRDRITSEINSSKKSTGSKSSAISSNQSQSVNKSRPTFVTFEVQPQRKQDEQPQSRGVAKTSNDMEFEEFEFSELKAEVTKKDAPLKSAMKENVVSLNVSRQSPGPPPMTSNEGNNANVMHGSSNNGSHPQYIKHNKSQPSSSVAATGKFGALRRRKSRSGSNGTSPGKLLQETIYEEETEHCEDSTKAPEHSVKIMVSQTTAHATTAASSGASAVKPILKNRERTYETPVSLGNGGNDSSTMSSCNDNKNSQNSKGISFQTNSNNYGLQNSGGNPNDIYFDSSLSTVSTASKKKVQFDQRPDVVVCPGDSSGQDSYDEENDDSDQWSQKSDDEEIQDLQLHQQQQQQQYQPQQAPTFNSDDITRRINQNGEQIRNGNMNKANPALGPAQFTTSSSSSTDKKVLSSFEEEVIRKAALFAKSREENERKKEQERIQAEQQAQELQQQQQKNIIEEKINVNNLRKTNVNGSAASNNNNTNAVARTGRPNGDSTNNMSRQVINKPVNSQTNNGTCLAKGTATASESSKFSQANRESNQRDLRNNVNHLVFDSNKSNVNESSRKGNKMGDGNNPIINPNSLLFHDTTRIRLNQSRPALQENTFKLPNGNVSPVSRSRGITRLKQSNSFRSVSSVALRPREPPPPPPKLKSAISTSSLASVPARLQKALSTSTLLSKSTEKLNNIGSSLSISSAKSNSHYGPGGKLLPSKAQISLPLGFTTTSKTAGLLASGSVETLTHSSSPKSPNNNKSPKSQTTTPPSKGNLKARKAVSSSVGNLAQRSKSLTDRCEALEKVLRGQKSELTSSAFHLPKDDIDSKSIEIVTKDNNASEIRIYSATTAQITGGSAPLPIHPTENLPYQGIIYESTKTLITSPSSSESPSPPPPPPKDLPAQKPSEIHYAATDLFPSPPIPPSPSRKSPAPFSHPPLPPVPTPTASPPSKPTTPSLDDHDNTGKSLILHIDNKRKSTSNPQEPALTYSQPIDTISGRSQPPQIPLPSIPPSNENSFDNHPLPPIPQDAIEEPLYDDVIHSDPSPGLPAPSKLKSGSLGRKSLSSLPHQLGELPPLPPPPVPPHRTPLPEMSAKVPQTSGQVVSSTLPCLACPPSLPPPNLPSKSLSEFHNRPLVYQESGVEESSVINHSSLFPDEEDVDNLYNDIGTPKTSSSSSSGTMKSSTAAAFASAMKEAFLGLTKGNGKEYDRRSVISTSSGSSSSSKTPVSTKELIYDDTLSIISSSYSPSGKGTINQNVKNNEKTCQPQQLQQLVPLPPPPQPPQPQQQAKPTNKSSLLNNEIVEEMEGEEDNDPLYDDVLNLTGEKNSEKCEKGHGNTGGGSEYHSSNTSDSGTEDLPPPLPAQGPPPMPKGGSELSLITFPLIQPSSKSGVNLEKKDESMVAEGNGSSDRTRNLLTELNEKLSKLNFSGEGQSSAEASNASSTSPGSTSLTSSGTNGDDKESSDFGSYHHHISKVVISPSSESSGVEEDYNSEKNYSLSTNGSDGASSGGGSDNENSHYGKSKGRGTNGGNSGQDPGMPSQAITMARGKFLENMKLSMLGMAAGGGNAGGSQGGGLLMLSTNGVLQQNKEEEEPIYEEIMTIMEENMTKKSQTPEEMKSKEGQNKITMERKGVGETVEEQDNAEAVVENEESDRNVSPIYADAFDAKSMFDGASRSEILSFLESIRDRLTGAESTSSSESQSSSILSSTSGTKKGADPIISLQDVSELCVDEPGEKKGSDETGSVNSSSLPEMQMKLTLECDELSVEKKQLLCPDCNDDIQIEKEKEAEAERDEVGIGGDPTVNTGLAHPGTGKVQRSGSALCRSCNRKRNEKKEIIMEIYETELKYGRDLKIIVEEFYKPIQIAGLLTKEQLDLIFLNVDMLMKINQELTGRLKEAIQKEGLKAREDRNEQEILSDVNVGKIFLELGEDMMTAFENYCTRQANAGALLSQLEKEKELLRIFLRVSQMENTVLRRMNLPAFLMVPVQRVTRYPLLLSRLLKVTPVDHFSREELQSAQEKIEQHLEHMNKTTREVASVKLWRRISIINGNSSNSNSGAAHRRSNSDLDSSNIRIRKMAMDVLDWTNFGDVSCIIDNQLGSVHMNGKVLRNIYGCLLARGKDLDLLASKIQEQDLFFPPAGEDAVKDVKLVLVRVKNTRFCLLREPLCLSKCVVSQGENEFQDYIEINEITTKNTYFIQAADKQSTATWLKYLQCYSCCVGHWRRRRPALANIMMNGMIKHV